MDRIVIEKILAAITEAANTVGQTLENLIEEVKGIFMPKRPLIEFGRYMFAHDDKSLEIQSKWRYQVLQGNFPEDAARLKANGVEVIRYCHPATYRGSEVDAIGVLNHERFFLKDTTGNVIKRYYNGEENGTFVDVGDTEYQKLSAEFLIKICREQGWDGVLFDEVNHEMAWAGYTTRPKKYATDYAFQTKAWLPYIKYVSAALKEAGLKVYANIAFAGEYDYWCKNVLNSIDGTLHEMFIGREDYNDTASWENWGFKIQYSWMLYNESLNKESLYQVRTTDPQVVIYALATLLLGVKENTKAKFAWATGDPGIVESHQWNEWFDKVELLGQPGVLTSNEGVYKRVFANGYVLVNSHESAVEFEGHSIPPLTGRIIIND